MLLLLLLSPSLISIGNSVFIYTLPQLVAISLSRWQTAVRGHKNPQIQCEHNQTFTYRVHALIMVIVDLSTLFLPFGNFPGHAQIQ